MLRRNVLRDTIKRFSEMIQRFIHAEFPQLRSRVPSSSFSSSFCALLPSFVDLPPAIPLLKTRAGARGDSRWSFSMDLHYLQTGFSRCEIKIVTSHHYTDVATFGPTEARRKNRGKGVESSLWKTNDSRRVLRRIYASLCPPHGLWTYVYVSTYVEESLQRTKQACDLSNIN